MAIGGSKFLLERTWKAAAGSSTTFNAPGNIVIPYGRYNITVTGRGGTGPTGSPSNLAGYNPPVPGNANYNPLTPGNPAYNPIEPGNINYNPVTPGNPTYNPISGGNPAYNPPGSGFGVTSATYISDYWPTNGYTFPSNYSTSYYTDASCPSPTSSTNYYFVPGGYGPVTRYTTINYSCSPTSVPGNYAGTNPPSGGNYAGENPSSGGNYAGENPSSGGNYAGVNPPSGGNYVSGNPASPGNANYNTATSPTPGSPTTVLGVTFPGGSAGLTASVVSPTTINRYAFPDGTTYPVTIPSGSYVTINIS